MKRVRLGWLSCMLCSRISRPYWAAAVVLQMAAMFLQHPAVWDDTTGLHGPSQLTSIQYSKDQKHCMHDSRPGSQQATWLYVRQIRTLVPTQQLPDLFSDDSHV